jgi:hypothetical protein
VIADLTSADAGHYALTVSNQCGMATSDDAILTIACPADWDQSGAANSADFFAFLNDFFGGAADFNGDGVTSSQDYFDFLTAYFAGC